jgi:hypothetical protein
MARLNNNSNTVRKGLGPLSTTGQVVQNPEGGLGYKRDPRSELFLATVTSLNEDTFYETAEERQNRIAKLVSNIATDADWVHGLVDWLRNVVGLRSVPTIIAVETVKARLDAGLAGKNRSIIRAAIGRIDEASDVLAYWMSRHGRRIPSCVKRGVGDALNTLLTENSFLKWRGRASNGAVSLRDVLNLTHPTPKDVHQEALFNAVIADAYNRDFDDSNLPIIKARREFLALSKTAQIELLTGNEAERIIRKARLTHEVVAGALGKIPAEVWDNLVPFMGYQALRMNLRRIADSGIGPATIAKINSILADEKLVANSRTMPIEFLAAYRSAPLDFAGALQQGANGALSNIPQLAGRTLILVDNSGSMYTYMSRRGTLLRSDAANMFAAALALRAENAEVWTYNDSATKQEIRSNDLLRVAEAMPAPFGGTDTRIALETAYNGHDRVILLTDEQNGYLGYNRYYNSGTVDVFEGVIPTNVPTFTWNLAGYEAAQAVNKPGRFTFGGLSDKGFQMIPLIERGFDTGWPWEK